MANRFWVGGTATWDSTAGSKWATTSGGAGGAALPTAADDVFIDAASGAVTVTGTSASVARSINFTGFTGTFVHSAATVISIGDATAGASNIALKFVAGMTYTKNNADTSAFSFISTSTTQQDIDTGGKTMGNMTFNGAGGSWKFAAAFTQANTSTLTFTNGSVDTNNQACSWGVTALGVGTKALTLGSSTVTIIGSGLNFATNITGFTLTAGTSSLVFNPTAAVAPAWSPGGNTFYDVSVTKSSGGFVPTGSVTLRNFTMDNTVLGSGNRSLNPSGGAVWTVSGVFTYTANNATSSRGRMLSGTQANAVTVDLGTTGTASLTDIDFEDIAFTGTNTPVTAAGGSRLADGGGNSGITFAAPVTYYWIGNGGNMSSVSKYSTSSGGAAGSVIPLVHDVLVFDANSITSGSQTIVNDMMRMPGLDFTNVLNSPVYNPRNPNGAQNLIYGDFILKAGMTVSDASASGGTIPHNFRGRGTHTINHAGVDTLTTLTPTFAGIGGSYTLQSDVTYGSTRTFTLSSGTFDANGFNVTTGLFSSSNTSVRTLNMGSGTWTITGTGTVWGVGTTTNLTYNVDTSTVIIADTGASSKTVQFAPNIAFNILQITPGGAGQVILGASGNRRINTLSISGGSKTIQLTVTNPYPIMNITLAGTAGNLVSFVSLTPGTTANITGSTSGTGSFTASYTAFTDINANAGPSIWAVDNCTDNGNNHNVIFAQPKRLGVSGVG